MDTGILRSLIERLNGQYRAAIGSAYCPSSEAHKQQIKAALETNRDIEAYLSAVDSVMTMKTKKTATDADLANEAISQHCNHVRNDTMLELEKVENQLLKAQSDNTRLREALSNQNFWVEGALTCKEWDWDPDQREAAESCLACAKEALTTPNAEYLTEMPKPEPVAQMVNTIGATQLGSEFGTLYKHIELLIPFDNIELGSYLYTHAPDSAARIKELEAEVTALRSEAMFLQEYQQQDPDDAEFEIIERAARESYRHSKSQVRGTTITRSDGIEAHIIWATRKFDESKSAKESAALKEKLREAREALNFYSGAREVAISFKEEQRRLQLSEYRSSPYWNYVGEDGLGHELFRPNQTKADEALVTIGEE